MGKKTETMLESEDTARLPTTYVGAGRCPYRGGYGTKDGWVDRPALDERCPPRIPCLTATAEAPGKQEITSPVPVVEPGSYCQTCLTDRVREKEAK